MSVPVVAALFVVSLLASPAAWAEAREPDPVRGARLYSANCARCHNYRSPVELGDREWSIVIAHMRVVAGLPGSQARDIDAFLRSGNNPPRVRLPQVGAGPPPTSGHELIQRNACQGCHVIGGVGGTAGPNLDTVFERRDEQWIRAQIKNPRQHNPETVMPVLGLSDAEVTAIMDTLRRRRVPAEESAP